MNSKDKRVLQEVRKMLFLAETTRKEAQDKSVAQKPIQGPFLDYKSTNEKDLLPFPMKYAMVSRGGESFKEDMAYAFLSLKEAGKSTEEAVAILAPHLKGDKSFKAFIQSLDQAQEISGIKSPNQAAELIYQIPEEMKQYGDAAKKRYFEHAFGDEKSMISYNWSNKKLSPRGYWQLQYLARLASNKPSSPEESAILSSRRSDLYKRRAEDTLRSFYKKAILPMAIPLMGRDAKDIEIADRDVEFKISIEDAVDKMIDGIGQYDASKNNIGAWAFTVMKNQLKDTLKKFTTQKLRTGIDSKSGINISDAFENNNWNTWTSTLSPETSMGENGGIDKDRIGSVDQIEDGVWKYKFKSAADAYVEFTEAADGEANNIFTRNNLTKSELQKLKDVGAFLSVKKDVGFEEPGSSEQPDIADDAGQDDKEKMNDVDANESYEDIFEELLTADENLGSQVKNKISAYLSKNGTEELGRALFHFIQDFDYKFFKNRDKKISRSDFDKLLTIGKEKYDKDWKNFPKEKFGQSLGKKYTNDEGDIYPELEPYVLSKMVKRGQEGGASGAGTKISREDFEADQKSRGVDALKKDQLDVLAGAAGKALKGGIGRNTKLGKTIEKLFNYERGNLEENMSKNLNGVIKEAIQEVLAEMKPRTVTLEAKSKINLLKHILAPRLVRRGFKASMIKEDFKIKSNGSFAGNINSKYEDVIFEDAGLRGVYDLIVNDLGTPAVISEATSEDWASHIKNRWTGEGAKWPMTPEEVDAAEKEVSLIGQGKSGYGDISDWLKQLGKGSGSKKAPYTINRAVEEYQKTGNSEFYNWLLTVYSIDPSLKDRFIGKLREKFGLENIGSDTIGEYIDNAVLRRLESMMQKYNPDPSGGGDFYSYTFAPRVSNILRDVQTQIEKTYDISLDADGDTASDLEKAQDKQAIDKHQADSSNSLSDQANELKQGVYNNLKSTAGEAVANAYYDYFIKGAPQWTDLVEDSEDWERYGIRGRGKNQLANKVLMPGLVKKGMNAADVKKDFSVNKNTGALAAIPNDRKIAYEAAIADDKVLKKIYNFIANDQDLNFRDPNTVPLSYIWNKGANNPNPSEKSQGFIGNIEAILSKKFKEKWEPIIAKIDAKYPGIGKVLLTNPYKGQATKPVSHKPDWRADLVFDKETK